MTLTVEKVLFDLRLTSTPSSHLFDRSETVILGEMVNIRKMKKTRHRWVIRMGLEYYCCIIDLSEKAWGIREGIIALGVL